MKKPSLAVITAFLLCALSSNTINAQNRSQNFSDAWSTKNFNESSRWEIGLSGGATLYYGDLAVKGRDPFDEATSHGNLLARYYLGHNFSLRGNIYVGKLAGADALYNDPEWRRHRNFSFTSILGEASVVLEYDLLHEYRDNQDGKWGLYGFVGIGVCYTDPKRDFTGLDAAYFGVSDKAVSGLNEDVNRNPRHIGVVAPLGLGIRYQFTKRLSVFAEGSVHQGFDDKIDGFSSSVSSGKKDAYAFFSLGLNLRFKRRHGWWNANG